MFLTFGNGNGNDGDGDGGDGDGEEQECQSCDLRKACNTSNEGSEEIDTRFYADCSNILPYAILDQCTGPGWAIGVGSNADMDAEEDGDVDVEDGRRNIFQLLDRSTHQQGSCSDPNEDGDGDGGGDGDVPGWSPPDNLSPSPSITPTVNANDGDNQDEEEEEEDNATNPDPGPDPENEVGSNKEDSEAPLPMTVQLSSGGSTLRLSSMYMYTDAGVYRSKTFWIVSIASFVNVFF